MEASPIADHSPDWQDMCFAACNFSTPSFTCSVIGPEIKPTNLQLFHSPGQIDPKSLFLLVPPSDCKRAF